MQHRFSRHDIGYQRPNIKTRMYKDLMKTKTIFLIMAGYLQWWENTKHFNV